MGVAMMALLARERPAHRSRTTTSSRSIVVRSAALDVCPTEFWCVWHQAAHAKSCRTRLQKVCALRRATSAGTVVRHVNDQPFAGQGTL